MIFVMYIPTGVDPKLLESEIRGKLKKSDGAKVDVDVV